MLKNTNVAALFPQAVAMHQAGKLDEAVAIYRRILAANSRNADALHMCSLLHMQQGNWREGARLARDFLKIHPNQPEVLNNLGYALQNLGDNEESLGSYDKALRLNPAYAAAWYNRGNVLQNMGRYEDAVESYQQAVAVRPGHADSWVNLGKACKQLERYDEARACYEKALALAPNNAVAHNNLGNVLNELKQYDQALASLQHAITLVPDYADAHLNLALVLERLRRHDEALAGYDRAIALSPENPNPYSRKGSLLVELGRMAEAEQAFMQSLDLDANESASLAGLLSIKKSFREDDVHFQRMQQQYASRESLPQNEQIFLSFAMGKALEILKHYDEAFSAYDAGNRMHYARHPYDEAEEERFLESTCSFFSRELMDKFQQTAAMLPPYHDDRMPIFIVGMPRSGTTLIEQVLASHPSLFGAGELAVMGELARNVELSTPVADGWQATLLKLRELGREYLDRVWKQAPDAHIITDKMPHNFKYLGLIHLMLPNAKIIHALRDPMDSCFSCYAMKFREGHEYSYSMETLGRHYLMYRRLMAHWHQVLPPGRILDVRYEDTVADLEGQARRMLEYVGLPWDPACLKFHENKRVVSTASVTQVRQPIYSSSVARWKHFENHLGPLIEIVRSVN